MEDVGADVVTTEGVEVPVGFNSRNFGIVAVERVVLRTDEFFRDRVSEKDGVDAVLLTLSIILVKCWREDASS